VEARNPPVLFNPILNWSPTVDFIVTPTQSHFQLAPNHNTGKIQGPTSSGRVFVLAGCRGKPDEESGAAMVEMRYGHEARLRVESELDVPISEAWYLPTEWGISGVDATSDISTSLILLSTGNQSSLLNLAADDSSIEETDQSLTWLDLSSRTLTATACQGVIIQITERSVNISTQSPLYVISFYAVS
jgi:hypothetical protein